MISATIGSKRSFRGMLGPLNLYVRGLSLGGLIEESHSNIIFKVKPRYSVDI